MASLGHNELIIGIPIISLFLSLYCNMVITVLQNRNSISLQWRSLERQSSYWNRSTKNFLITICLQWPTDLGVASIQNDYLPSHYVLSASEFPLSRYDHLTNTTIFIKGLPITTKIILMLRWIQKDLPDGSLGPQQFVCSPLGRG